MNDRSTKQRQFTKILTYNAVIGALYAVLVIFLPLSYGAFQFRFAECLVILPIFFPPACIGLAVGCAVANIFSVAAIPVADVVFGSLTTLAAGLLTAKIKKFPWAFLPPIVLNAFIIPLILLFFGGETVYWLNVLLIGAGQTAVIFGLGTPLYFLIKKNAAHFGFFTLQNGKPDSTAVQETRHTEPPATLPAEMPHGESAADEEQRLP